MTRQWRAIVLCLLLLGCTREAPPDNSLASYFDHTGRDDVLAGGIRMIPIETPNGSHLAIYDDQATYFKGLIEFLKKVDSTG